MKKKWRWDIPQNNSTSLSDYLNKLADNNVKPAEIKIIERHTENGYIVHYFADKNIRPDQST